MPNAAHREVARPVKEQPGLLRRSSANTVLALLAASALSPVAVEVLGGGSVTAAIAEVEGNVGSGYLTDLVTGIAARLRRKGSADVGEARNLLSVELSAALEKNDTAADELRGSLAALLIEVGGLEAAADELHRHLMSCFDQLRRRDAEQERRDQRLLAAQHRTSRQLERQARLQQEVLDRLRLLTRDVPRHRPPLPGRRSSLLSSSRTPVRPGTAVYAARRPDRAERRAGATARTGREPPLRHPRRASSSVTTVDSRSSISAWPAMTPCPVRARPISERRSSSGAAPAAPARTPTSTSSLPSPTTC